LVILIVYEVGPTTVCDARSRAQTLTMEMRKQANSASPLKALIVSRSAVRPQPQQVQRVQTQTNIH